jgi:hypothetical protein
MWQIEQIQYKIPSLLSMHLWTNIFCHFINFYLLALKLIYIQNQLPDENF